MKESSIHLNLTDQRAETPFFYIGSKGQAMLLSPVLVTGLIYVIMQWARTGYVADAFFVGLLFGASLTLASGMAVMGRHLLKKGLPFFLEVVENTNRDKALAMHNRLCHQILGTRNMTLAGIAYGLIIGSAPFVLSLWEGDPVLRGLLAVFLFTVNVITGAGLYALIRFMEQLYRLAPSIQIDLWQANSGKTDFLLSMTRKLTILASIYISLSMVSILFSEFSFDAVMIGYAGFAGLIFLSVLFISPAPIVGKLKSAKLEALDELDTRIQQLFASPHPGNNSGSLDDNEQIMKLKNLLDLREKVENMNTWPFKMKSVLAGLSVVFFSALPVLVRVILDYFF